MGIFLLFFPNLLLVGGFSVVLLPYLLFTFVVSTVVEWLVYLAVLKWIGLSVHQLFKASFWANAVSHAMIAAFVVSGAVKEALL